MKKKKKNNKVVKKEAYPLELFQKEVALDAKSEGLLLYKEIGILISLILFVILRNLIV